MRNLNMTASFKRDLKLRGVLEDYKDSERYNECIDSLESLLKSNPDHQKAKELLEALY